MPPVLAVGLLSSFPRAAFLALGTRTCQIPTRGQRGRGAAAVPGGWKGLALGCQKGKKGRKRRKQGRALLSPPWRGGGDTSSPAGISLSPQG